MARLQKIVVDRDYLNEMANRYYYLVARIQRMYFPNVSYDTAMDLQSEGAIGLTNAINSFRPESYAASFPTYASLLIKNAMIDYTRSSCYSASRREQLLLDASCSEDSDISMMDYLTMDQTKSDLVLDSVLDKENREEFYRKYQSWFRLLTEQEQQVFLLRMKGKSYREIGTLMGFSDQTASNRAKSLARKYQSL